MAPERPLINERDAERIAIDVLARAAQGEAIADQQREAAATILSARRRA